LIDVNQTFLEFPQIRNTYLNKINVNIKITNFDIDIE